MPDQGRPGSLAHRLSATTRILAVEDEDDIAEFLRAYFRASGYDLVHVDPSSPDEVVDAIDEHKPDLILLDYGLRGFSGDEAYQLIRAQERFAFVPVIVVTGDATARARSADTATGLDGFVAKPFNVNTLAGLVAERIEAARAVSASGRDETLGLMTQAYLTARLSDEINERHADIPCRSLSVQLAGRSGRSKSAAGSGGVTSCGPRAITVARRHPPEAAVLGRTDANELAVLVSGPPASEIEPHLARALAPPWQPTFRGGAEVQIDLAAGLASFLARRSVDAVHGRRRGAG